MNSIKIINQEKNNYNNNVSYYNHEEENKSNSKQQLLKTIENLKKEIITPKIESNDSNQSKIIKNQIIDAIDNLALINRMIKESKHIDQEDYELLLQLIEKYYQEYKILTQEITSNRKKVIKVQSQEETKNIIIFLKDKKTQDFCIIDNLEANGKKDLQKTLNKAFCSNLKLLTNKRFEDIRQTKKIKKIKNNNLPNNRDENYPWEVRRKDSTRMSIIFPKICEENKEKLRQFYNIPQLENIILVGGIIKVADEYNKLAPLTKQLEDNKDYISSINDILSNPNSTIDELNKIISESSSIYQTLEENQKHK